MAISSSCLKFWLFFLFVGISYHHVQGATIEVTIEDPTVVATFAIFEYGKNE